MPAYLVVTAQIHDREAFLSRYGPAAAELTRSFGGKYLVRAPGIELLEGEGPAGGSLVISEWPDKATAMAFWNSPEYGRLKEARQGLADCNVLVVEAP